jgi:eukaryotic-like serine/threonine-protein kinase
MTTLVERLQVATGDRYAIERELGRGGMATVLLAQDLRHHRAVAIKVLRPDVAVMIGAERFLREIQVAAGLSHPHILPLHDSGAGEGLLYYVMPFVEGESLRDRLAGEGALPIAEAVRLVGEVADALEYAHQHGVIHRDIKPENILLSSGHAVVADFGIARAVNAAADPSITEVGAAVGSPMYMSPEQVEGEPNLDGRSDIYSLGCVLFEAITGRPPFSGSNAQAVMARRLLETPPPLRAIQPSAPAGLEAAISRALARDRAQRFRSAGEFSAALKRLESNANAPAVASQGLTSIAVLPFANLSREADSEYFSDGMTDELMGALARVPQLRVAARTSCHAFKGKETDIREIGRVLRVGVVLEGSVRKAGSRIRLNVQLVDTDSGYHIWSETYDRDLGDVFALQDELASTIAGALRLKLLAGGSIRRPAPTTNNLEAFTLYLRGRFQANLRTMDGLAAAIGYLDRAVTADPRYAAAHAELGSCWALRSFPEFGDLPAHQGMPKAREAIGRALELDPSSAAAHGWGGVITMLHDRDLDGAETAMRHSLELDSEYALGHTWLAVLLAVRLRFDDSLESIHQALALDPLSVTSQLVACRCFFWAARFQEALQYASAVQEAWGSNILGIVWKARILRQLGRFDETLELLEAGMEQFGQDYRLLGPLAVQYARIGRTDRTREIGVLLGGATWDPYYGATVHAALGDFDRSVELLRQSADYRSGLVAFTGVNASDFGDLRFQPRFQALLAELGLRMGPA